MAVPKRKHSKSRRNKRRANQALKTPNLSLCSQCNEPKLPHRACPHCGFYRGREIIETGEE